MSRKIEMFVGQSGIVRFFSGLNKNLVVFFYSSLFYKLFRLFNSFFFSMAVKSLPGSRLISAAKKICSRIGAHDIGLFIVAAVIFNTAIMMFLKIGIDAFSATGRVLFSGLGLILIARNT